MTPTSKPLRSRIDGLALLLSAVAAPAAAFLLWATWAFVMGDLGATSPLQRLLGAAMFTLLIAAWGAMPAAAFGAPILWMVQRLFGQASLPVLMVAGMAAAGAYAGVSAALSKAGQDWVFLIAPWTAGVLDPAERSYHPASSVIVAIVVSGAIGGLTYWRVARRGVRPA